MSNVNIQLEKNERNLVIIANNALMLACIFFSLAVAVCLRGILTSLNHIDLYTIFVVIRSAESALGMLIAGPLGNKFGRKRLLQILIPVEIISAVLCGIAGNIIIFSIGIVTLGIVNGILIATTYAVIADVIERPSMGKYFGYAAIILNVATLVTPLIAGMLTDRGIASFTFLVPVPLLVIAYPLFMKSFKNKAFSDAPLDYIGFFLITVAVAGISIVFSLGGKTIPWTSPIIFILLGMTAVSVVLMSLYFKKVKAPILDFEVFKNKEFTTSAIFSALKIPLFTIFNVFMVLYVQVVLQQSATSSGSFNIPKTIVTVLMPMLLTVVMSKKDIRMSIMKGSFIVLLITSVVLYIAVGTDITFMLFLVASALVGICDGMQSVTLSPYGLSTLPGEKMGSANSLFTFIPAIISTITTALFGMINDNMGDLAKAFPIMCIISIAAAAVSILIAFTRLPKDKQTQVKDN